MSGADAVRLLAIRHGRTAWNVARRYQGRADPPLDEVGVAQAAALAEALAGCGARLVASSDQHRALDTAAPLAARLGVDLLADPRLREADVGRWEGMAVAEVAERFGAEREAWRAGTAVAGGGRETLPEAGGRAAGAIVEHALALGPGATLAVVSHGMVLRAALRHLRSGGLVSLDADPDHLGNTEWVDLRLTLPGA